LTASRSQKPDQDSETQRILRHWRDVVPNDRMAHLVKDAIRALNRALQVRLAEHGVSLGHWPYLRVLWESDGLTQRELSREAGVMEPTTFAAMKAMQERGYIVRRQLANNRRKVHIFLTAKGRALKTKLVPLAQSVNGVAMRGVSPTDVAITRRTLLAAIENLANEELRSAAYGADLPGGGKSAKGRQRHRRPATPHGDRRLEAAESPRSD
jgi:DNA-binding MarR family transcriptional regulator